jgi:hypothetical protein
MEMVRSHVKTIGDNGQISLGIKNAHVPVLIEERAPGVWLIRKVIVYVPKESEPELTPEDLHPICTPGIVKSPPLPENEAWLHQTKAMNDLESALTWALTHPIG